MSETVITVVETSLPAADAPRQAFELTATLDAETHTGLIEPWLAGPEPQVTCGTCGNRALVGDWIGHGDEFGQWTFQVGELSVSFNNWPLLSPAFLTELGVRMGARWRVVSERR